VPAWTTWSRDKSCSLPGLELQPFGRPANSQSLYLLHFPASYVVKYVVNSSDYTKLNGRKFSKEFIELQWDATVA
jgi:hypothetical protein